MNDAPLVPDGSGSRGRRSRARVAVMLVVGAAVALATGLGGGWVYAPLAGWDVAALVFAVSVWAGTVRSTPTAPGRTPRRRTRRARPAT